MQKLKARNSLSFMEYVIFCHLFTLTTSVSMFSLTFMDSLFHILHTESYQGIIVKTKAI